MSGKKLHPSVLQFKEFLQKHPHLIKKVRNGETTWQTLYEDWYLLGEDDPKWKASSSEDRKKDTAAGKHQILQQLLSTFKNMDIDQIQLYIQNLSSAIETVQGILSQFQQNQGQEESSERRDPFLFRRD
jgi:hypothetical protein